MEEGTAKQDDEQVAEEEDVTWIHLENEISADDDVCCWEDRPGVVCASVASSESRISIGAVTIVGVLICGDIGGVG